MSDEATTTPAECEDSSASPPPTVRQRVEAAIADTATLWRTVLLSPPPTVRQRVEAAIADTATLWRDRQVYLVEYGWWTLWRAHVGQLVMEGASSPGPIGNALLTRSEDALASGLAWRVHYEILPPLAWTALLEEYGGGPSVCCDVSEVGRVLLDTARFSVGVDAADEGSCSREQPEDGTAFAGDETSSCSACGIELDVATASGCARCGAAAYCARRCQLSHWRYHKRECKELARMRRRRRSPSPRSPSTTTLKRSTSSKMLSIISSDEDEEDESVAAVAERLRVTAEHQDLRRGCAGLANVGNTCYFNATLQCLNRVGGPLTRHFLSDRYLAEVNESNPLGCGGRLAREYSQVLKRFWQGHERVVTPTGLLNALARKNDIFSGRMQHDAHEFLATMLDGLHEDLNLVRKKKPYFEKPSSENNEDDARVAFEAMALNERRDSSVVVDHFFGLLRSTLECPACESQSASFDAFSTIELELDHPEEAQRRTTGVGRVVVYFESAVYFAPSIPLPPDGTSSLRAASAAALGVDESRVVLISGTTPIADDDDLPETIFHDLDNDDDLIIAACVLPEEGRLAFVKRHSGGPPALVAYEPEWPVGRLIDAVREATHGGACRLADGTAAPEDATCADWIRDAFATIVVDQPADVEEEPTPAEEELDEVPAPPAEEEPPLEELPPDMQRRFLHFCQPTRRQQNIVNLSPFAMLTTTYKPTKLTLEACLRHYTRWERLDADNLWFCEKCGERRRAAKRIALWKAPKILVFALKRFDFRAHGAHFHLANKLDTEVDFPLVGLNMAPFVAHGSEVLGSSCEYELTGVVNHYGETGYGHYTAFARDLSKDRDEWLKFDDSRVSTVSADEVRSRSAYILFYARTDYLHEELSMKNKKSCGASSSSANDNNTRSASC